MPRCNLAVAALVLGRCSAFFHTSISRPLISRQSLVAPIEVDPIAASPGAEMLPAGLEGVRPDIAATFGKSPPGLLDVDSKLSESTFPLKPDVLIGLTKAWLTAQEEGDESVNWFAQDFRFVAPVVGPFGRDEFQTSLKGFDLLSAFPDLKANPHHFRVDPWEPSRVWWSVKYEGTNSGPVMGRPATGKKVDSPVQAQSLTFNSRGEIEKFTIGYVLDKETGNTGGLGGVFGLFYAIGYGLPFPEAQPYTPSPIYGTLMKGNQLIQKLFTENPAFKKGAFGAMLRGGE